ncbi:cytochrome bc1 complex Rieske iron-sulfur subunit [Microbispora rosea subsp. aerata]|nr:Rieske 2Fe-2S domain-containing protein [Microbispora rosea]GGO07933.1 cytochrome bc1 complex Rieske iron-sulfur subunit [Microbispora rosea subsp. aerata]GIH53301.1 cytochrome bc1 complex Rieske iron-sulfur subunit [Microbispora rosea subsp. aerata]GLJ83785.1 cytochrome bc1 complex Rieske iron-sulfur subunit [Microbispora rosea subsp. aerata]
MTDNEHETGQPERRTPPRVIGTPLSDPLTGSLPEPLPGAETAGDDHDGDPAVPRAVPQDERKARKAEKIAALCFMLTFAALVAFLVAYVRFQVGGLSATGASHIALGGALTLALLALASGIVIWVRQIMPKYEMVQQRHPMASSADVRAEIAATFVSGAAESGIVKRRLLRRTLLLAAAPLGLAPLVLLRDLDSTGAPVAQLHKRLAHTVWGEKAKEGKPLRLVVEGTGQPIRAADFNSPGGILSVVPEGYEHDLNVLAKATVILIKFRPEEFKPGTNLNWTHDGIVAYSKICTHVGCPAALYEQTTHHILCPCHQSTFDAADGAKVVFGPAARPLPQLPIGVDEQGYLIALGDFPTPVGPSYWERGDAEARVRENGGHS